MTTGNTEKWCKGDQTWGIVKASVLILRKNQMQQLVFTEMCFLFQLATPISKNILPLLLQIHLEGPQSRMVSQLSVHCILLLTMNWSFSFSFFSSSVFPTCAYETYSRWIKIDQGLLFLINSMIWLHFTKRQTPQVSLSQHSSLWLSKTCFPWTVAEFNQQMKTNIFFPV